MGSPGSGPLSLPAADELAGDPELTLPELDADPNQPSDDVLLRPTSKDSLSPQALVRHNLHSQDKDRVPILLTRPRRPQANVTEKRLGGPPSEAGSP